MPTDRKKTAKKSSAPKPARPARTTQASSDVVYVAYKGTSDLRIPAPGHGHTYVFKRLPARNEIPTSVWEEISNDLTGKAAIYIRKRVLRKVGKGDSFTTRVKAEAIPIAQSNLPQVTAVASGDASKDELIARLQVNLANLTRQLQEVLASKPVRGALDDEPEDFDDDGGDEGEDASDGPIDPADFNGKTIKKAIDGLSLEALEEIKDREEQGKNRPAVLKVIEASIDAALAAEEQG